MFVNFDSILSGGVLEDVSFATPGSDPNPIITISIAKPSRDVNRLVSDQDVWVKVTETKESTRWIVQPSGWRLAMWVEPKGTDSTSVVIVVLGASDDDDKLYRRMLGGNR